MTTQEKQAELLQIREDGKRHDNRINKRIIALVVCVTILTAVAMELILTS